MMNKIIFFIVFSFLFIIQVPVIAQFETDTIQTSDGNLIITFIGHGSLMFSFNGKIIHADPYNKLADYSTLPKADIILVTHHHGDHLDQEAIEKIKTEKTTLVFTEVCKEKLPGGVVLKNGETKKIDE
ncbi:MAG TPA: MBL fold metallo-hydrolase, partial [Ignavibacteriaceae bacterium]|nr:MBL fold metallo-hydrolase [Ignavibacteriaceae bacterium]